MSTEIQVFINNQPLTVVLPERLAPVAVLLPIVTRLFSKDKHTVVLAKDLFAKLGGSYRPGRWLEAVVKDCRLEKDVDYFQVALDPSDPANFQAIAANRGVAPVYTYFTLKAARKITLRSSAEEAHIFFEFVDAVLDAVVPSLLTKLTAANQEALRQRSLADRNEAVALAAVRKVDGKLNITQFESAEQIKKRLGITQARLCDAEGAAFTLWEYSSKARRALAASKPQQAVEALQYLDKLFGNYSDLLRDEPPWSNDQS